MKEKLIETERINCILSFYAKAETEGSAKAFCIAQQV